MSFLPRPPRALLRFDAISVQRPSAAVDSEGNPTGARVAVLEGRGTISSAVGQLGSVEYMMAGERGTKIDKILSLELGLDVQAGDFVTANGLTYEVISIEPRRLFQRALMRKIV